MDPGLTAFLLLAYHARLGNMGKLINYGYNFFAIENEKEVGSQR